MAETREPGVVDPPIRAQVVAERRARILAAARKVFLAEGLTGARTREIAAEADVNEAVLYSHFASKDDIFVAAVFDPLEQLAMEFVEQMAAVPVQDPKRRRRVFAAENEATLRVMADVIPFLGVALYSNIDLGRTFFEERLSPLLQQWTYATKKAVTGWSHRDVDPRAITICSWGMHFGLALDANMHGRELDVTETAKETTQLIGLAHLSDRNRGRGK